MVTKDHISFDEASCRRKDFRRFFLENQPLFADCHTKDGAFRERVQNLSAKGVFLATHRRLFRGEEIALTIALDKFGAVTLKATGEVVRIEPDGVGVEFRVIFSF